MSIVLALSTSSNPRSPSSTRASYARKRFSFWNALPLLLFSIFFLDTWQICFHNIQWGYLPGITTKNEICVDYYMKSLVLRGKCYHIKGNIHLCLAWAPYSRNAFPLGPLPTTFCELILNLFWDDCLEYYYIWIYIFTLKHQCFRSLSKWSFFKTYEGY